MENSPGTSDGNNACECKSGYEWVTKNYINECQRSECIADPNSDGTEDGNGGCTCDHAYTWNKEQRACQIECQNVENSLGMSDWRKGACLC